MAGNSSLVHCPFVRTVCVGIGRRGNIGKDERREGGGNGGKGGIEEVGVHHTLSKCSLSCSK